MMQAQDTPLPDQAHEPAPEPDTAASAPAQAQPEAPPPLRALPLAELIAQADALTAAGQLQRAITTYRLALRLYPSVKALHFNLGLALLRFEHPQDAQHHFDTLLADPEQPDWLHQRARQALALALEQAGDTAAAAAQYRRLLDAEPDNFAVLRQLGTLYRDLGLSERALEAYAHCHRLWPAHAGIAVELAQLRLTQADWAALPDAAATSALAAACLHRPDGVEPPAPHVFLQLPGDLPLRTLSEIARAHAHYIEQAAGLPAGGALPPLHRSRDERRLHLAYAVHDVHSPSTAWIRQLLRGHNRARYEVSVYTWGADDGSAARELSQADAERAVDVHGWSDAAIAARLRADRVDVLLDPGSLARQSRPGIFARRPAPLQLAWLSDPVATCSGWFNALLSDAHQLGNDDHPWPSPVLSLPGCARTLPQGGEDSAGPHPDRKAVGLPPKAPVVACFAPASALSAPLYGIWIRQISALRGAVLWLGDLPRPVRTRLRDMAEAQGLPRNRLVFLSPAQAPDQHRLLPLADLVLDTGREEGAPLIQDALVASLPVLSLAGRHPLQRIGSSLLQAAACSAWVAVDLPSYETRLHDLLRQPRELMACRERLKQQSNVQTHQALATPPPTPPAP